MVKKTFTISLDEKLVKELDKRAKKDYLTTQELINQILWRSAKSSKDNRDHPNPRKAEDFVEIFSRYKPYHKNSKESYYCYKCKKKHKYNSKIGKQHIKHSKT